MRKTKQIWTRISVISLLIFILLSFLSSSVFSQNLRNPLMPDTLWIGKGKGYGVSNRAFPIPVEVHNIYDLSLIGLPLRIEEVSAFVIIDSIQYIDRLASDTILDIRGDAIQWVDGNSPDSFDVLAMISSPTRCLPIGSGRIFNFWFTGDSTGFFVIDTCLLCPSCSLIFGDCPYDIYHVPVFYSDTIEIRKCGDVNQDDEVTIADAVYLVNYVFKSGPEPVPIFLLGEVNEDNSIDIIDVVFLINYLFKDGDPPCDLRYPQCKTFQTGALADTTPPDQDCIEYQYDGEGTLVLNHINAGFNCCPSSLTADISIEQSLITITEYEHFENTGPCYCLCLFDVDYQINNLPPGEYTIKVNEVYLEEGDELLEFTVNLPPSPYSGSFCVTRSHYPWMP